MKLHLKAIKAIKSPQCKANELRYRLTQVPT
jgi:hypothetical protein